MRTGKYLLALLLTLGLQSCAHDLKSVPFTTTPEKDFWGNPQKARGPAAALARTMLSIEIPYRLRTTMHRAYGIDQTEKATAEALIMDPIAVTPQIIADDANRFIIDGAALSGGFALDATVDISVGPDGLLKAIATSAEDKGPEAIQSAITSVATIAKAVAFAAGQDTVIQSRIEAIDGAIGTLLTHGSKPLSDTDAKTLDALLSERAKLVTLLATLNAEKTDRITLSSEPIKYSVVIDPFAGTWDADNKCYVQSIFPSASLFGPPTPSKVEQVEVRVYVDEQSSTYAKQTLQKENGIPYRVARSCRVELSVITGRNETQTPATNLSTTTAAANNPPPPAFDANGPTHVAGQVPNPAAARELVLKRDILLAQAGPIQYVDARFKPWAKLDTTITFDTATGSLTGYKTVSTASATKAAAVLDTAANQLKGAIDDMNKAAAAKQSPEAIETARQNALSQLYAAQLKAGQDKAALEKYRADQAKAAESQPAAGK